ncbi:hypothetical protein AB0M54_04100 [Actinoplanes sp. NPDC051470]|uniref:hypothetical protein n=1 Tax=Actinoplanes sp. NPDC051470 TaxID=3157224 RepID=UPI0034192C0C
MDLTRSSTYSSVISCPVTSATAQERADALAEAYLPVSPEGGRLLYALTRAARPPGSSSAPRTESPPSISPPPSATTAWAAWSPPR